MNDLKKYLSESFSKEYSYRIKIAYDCDDTTMNMLEQCLGKYRIESLVPWKRQPIQENPVEFTRLKGVSLVSEVCSTDAVFKYPCQPRVLEVWIAAHLGIPHERVLVYSVKEPRRLESETAEARLANDVDRGVHQSDALLGQDDQDHYQDQNSDWTDQTPIKDAFYGEVHNQKFLDQLQKIKADKGEDYFRAYPTKDELMGDNLRPLWDEMNWGVNMGKGRENTKQVHDHNQQLPH